MKGNELVWRTCRSRSRRAADLAERRRPRLRGRRAEHDRYLLERLESNGTVDRYSRGGLAVVSIDKLLTMLCAWRNLERDTLAWTTREASIRFSTRSWALRARRRRRGERDPERPSRRGLQRAHRVPPRIRESHRPARRQVRVLSMDKRAANLERVLESGSDVCRSLRDARVAGIRVSERAARQLRAGPRMGSGR
jgi:hypothetical protein